MKSDIPVVHDFMISAPVNGYIEVKVNGVATKVDCDYIDSLYDTLLDMMQTNATGPVALQRLLDAVEKARLKVDPRGEVMPRWTAEEVRTHPYEAGHYITKVEYAATKLASALHNPDQKLDHYTREMLVALEKLLEAGR